jgi:hypothetical protein
MLKDPTAPLELATPPAATRTSRLQAGFVWGVWAVMSVALVSYVGLVNDDFPTRDDWHLVPIYTGHQPVTAAWLWEQYNEHRIPLPKFLLVVAGAVSGHDYRAGMFLNALALSGLAALMIVSAGRLGGVRFADAIFPLVLLHWGQYETLIVSYGLNLVASTFFGGVILVLIVRLRGAPTLGQAVAIGLCLIALPLCGSSGAVLVPALTLWLAVAGVSRWRSSQAHGRRDGAVMIAIAMAAAALLAVYLASLGGVSGRPHAGVGGVAEVALQVLAEGFGPAAEWRWPLFGVVLALVALLTLLKLGRDWRILPHERVRTLGLLCFGGAMVCLALGIGWGRGVVGTRYVTLAAPALCLAYFVGRPAPRPVLAWGLFALMAVLLPANTWDGIKRAEKRREYMGRLEADVAAGMTPAELGKKWAPIIYHPDGAAAVAERFEMLREAHQGPYR